MLIFHLFTVNHSGLNRKFIYPRTEYKCLDNYDNLKSGILNMKLCFFLICMLIKIITIKQLQKAIGQKLNLIISNHLPYACLKVLRSLNEKLIN